MQLPHSDEIEIRYLSRLFDKTSECYKFFWFQAIVTKVLEGKDTFSYEELIDEMIVDAWYMVTEYHLNLGPKDNLELLVKYIQSVSGMKPTEKKATILEYLHTTNNKEIIKLKQTLTKNVPYRLQSPFMKKFSGADWNVTERNLVEKINQQSRLMYYFSTFKGLETTIQMQQEWCEYLKRNSEIVKGWIQYKMIIYLQKRNPIVPGIANKLYPPTERKLDKVKKYWKMILHLHPIYEIYADIELKEQDISIDHFIPWSYVAHDELWNLHPTTKGINSSKSNNLPDWDKYFPAFCRQEFFSYEMIWKYDKVHTEFERCAKEHLNNEQIRMQLYRQGMKYSEFEETLSDVLLPIYQSAKNCGFGNWILKNASDED